MKKAKVLTIICFSLMAFAFFACRDKAAENLNLSPTISQAQKTFSKIEEVDFKNFTYPYPTQKIGEPLVKYFVLNNGEKPYGTVEDISFKLSGITYADLTNDGKNEAIVNIAVGLAVSNTNWIYVYTLNGDVNPHLNWIQIFPTRELENGGLKNLYAENGELVIELFGKNKFENDEWRFDSCCPKFYTQTRFILEGNKFVAVSSKLFQLSVKQTEKTYSSIRKVDFRNFAYVYPSDSSEKFVLINGRKEQTENEDGAGLGDIEYGDVTNDGKEEAFLKIQPITGGNCQCEMVFIYTLGNGKPKLLWSFDTEDRAAGGLKKIYAENGKLVVETFGDTRFENGEWDFRMPEGRASGLCCPTAYTKNSFEWNGETFAPIGERKIYDYDWRQQQSKRKS